MHTTCQYCYETALPCDCGERADVDCTGCQLCQEAIQADTDLNDMYIEEEMAYLFDEDE